MIFLFICFTYSKTVLNLISSYIPKYTLELFFSKLDVYEIIVPQGIGTFFSYIIDEDLYIFVETNDNTYGPFDSDRGLAAVFFSTVDYTVRIVNDGANNISCKLRFSDVYLESAEHFPDLPFGKKGEKIKNLETPFIYYKDGSGSKAVIVVMSIILGIVAAVAFFFGADI